MNTFINILSAEVTKEHRNSFYSKFIYFSLLIWPIITFINTYFSYKPFNLGQSSWNGLKSPNSILLFLLTGYLGYISFWSLVQNAATMRSERENGTLETIFLSPANRLAIIYGRSLGALVESIWMFSTFSVLLFGMVQGIQLEKLFYIPVSFIVILVTATVWGGLMNVIFLFSRDASIVFTICDEPMILFSGVRIPVSVFPWWAKILSVIFPLSHSISIVRGLLLYDSLNSILYSLLGTFFSLAILVLLTIWLLNKAENNARKLGNLSFY